MSALRIGQLRGLGKIEFKPSGWEVLAPWTSWTRMKAEEQQLKTERQIATAQQQADIEAKKREEARLAAARAAAQARTDELLKSVEGEASAIAQLVDEIRALLSQPFFAGTAAEQDAQRELAELETAVVQVQASFNVDSEDPDKLYADAAGARTAMRAIRSRVQGLKNKLEAALEAERAERQRQAELARQQAEAATRAAAEARRLEQERIAQAQLAARLRAQQAKLDEVKRIRELEALIEEEKRLLSAAQRELQIALSKPQEGRY